MVRTIRDRVRKVTDYASWMERYYGYYSGARVKIFKKRTDDELYVTLDKTDSEEQSDKDHGDVGIKESGLQLKIDIKGELESATNEGE